MSCITKLLELKGDREFLPVHDEVVIEGGGTYKDREYLIVFTERGHRCGYVALTAEETEIFEKERNVDPYPKYYYPDLECHGGITFYSNKSATKDLLPMPCDDMWVGFDAAHAGDCGDPILAKKYFPQVSDILLENMNATERFYNVTHKTFEYMEKECKDIIDQLIDKHFNGCIQ